MYAKYLVYAIVILIALFLVEALGIYDIPYLDVPNFFSGKEDLMQKTTEGMEELR
ncbi:MAG: hypothetical protein R6W75_04370 [Smithellaceae bacterium]